MPAYKDIYGKRFGRWTVVSFSHYHIYPSGSRAIVENCICDCGNTGKVFKHNLLSGISKSCGCLHSEISSRRWQHGEDRSKLYSVWQNMKRRCNDPRNPKFPHYGGRGITVCQEWMDSYISFRDFMGQPPSPDHSIDRINNDGNYEPGNVRWATRSEQQRNQRRNVILTIDGVSKTAQEWSEISGISAKTIRGRVKKGWSHYRAVFEPLYESKRKSTNICA